MPNFNLNFELFSKNISLFFSLSSKSVTMKKINYVKLRNEDFVGRMYEIARRRRLFGEPISRNLIITEALGSRPQRYYVSLTHACVTLGSSRNHGAFVKIEDFKMLKFRRIV